ncbi:MAG: dihydrolipoyl dehydrogenase [Acidobacteria bacterium]|nr:dihydrolipoyl dehydrogenase [Acidobacteriota bacterium]
MQSYDLIIIGAGPGGYVSAIYAAKHGLKTALIEKDDRLGGTCLNVGCIPTKTLIETAVLMRKIGHAKDFGVSVPEFQLDTGKLFKRKARVVDRLTKGVAFLMKENNVEVFHGTGAFQDSETVTVNGENSLRFKNCIIATGSVSANLPHIQADGKWILNSTGLLAMETLPESLVVIGGGVIGVEFASVFRTFGVSVTILEMMDQLIPGMDRDVAVELRKELKKMKVKVYTGARVTGAVDGVVTYEVDGEFQDVPADKVLLSVGRKPKAEGLNLSALGIETERGHIPVDARQETPVKGIYAIGDVIDTPKLAHLASREGLKAVHHILGIEDEEDIVTPCPAVVYSYPEIASVGMTTAVAEGYGLAVESVSFPLTANSKAYVEGIKSGFVKVVSEKGTGRILGVHIIGGKASEMIGEATLAIREGKSAEEMGRMIHPHPTVSESLMEAFHMAAGISIHI